ncbi:MAG: FAD-dependent oxidoreductase [Porticoccaceae bacterium]
MNAENYDVVIVGAGIHGAGVAQACAANGLRTLVLEKTDRPACGTSGASSKLIHGGLRYLETAQFRLVYESLHERELLCRIAPDLVQLKTFHLPVYCDSKRSPLLVCTGLFLYWLLSGFRRSAAFRSIGREGLAQLGIRQAGLRKLFAYQDAQTDDRALTAAVLQSARSLGAETRFSQELSEVCFRDGLYQITTGKGDRFAAKALVNAAGPWVNRVAQRFTDKPVEQMDISLVKGSHLIIDRGDMEDYFYLESPIDGRPMFVLPWKDKLMIGTTEQLFDGDPNQVACSAEEERYLLDSVNFYFPDNPIAASEISGYMAGLRVLPADDQRQLNRRSRDTLILPSQSYPNYFAIYGGKLTTYRAVSERLAKKLCKQLGVKAGFISTKAIKLGAE